MRNPWYRTAILKLRTSSHALEVERGINTKPKTPLEEGLCPNCHVLDDEQHFVIECTLYEIQRRVLINNIMTSFPKFSDRNVNETFVFLLQNADPNIQFFFAKFVYDAFQTKASRVAAQNRYDTVSCDIYLMRILASSVGKLPKLEMHFSMNGYVVFASLCISYDLFLFYGCLFHIIWIAFLQKNKLGIDHARFSQVIYRMLFLCSFHFTALPLPHKSHSIPH